MEESTKYKVCSRCKEKKSVSEFSKLKSSKDGLQYSCKKCKNFYYVKDREKILKRVKEYAQENGEKIKKYRKEYRLKNKDKLYETGKNYRNSLGENLKNKKKKYYLSNKQEIVKKTIKYKKKRMREDNLFYLSCRMRSLILKSFINNNYTKKSKTQKILGCTFEELKQHLESQFHDGMTWNNRGDWHIDHIIPVSAANNEEELIKLNHYTNLQPLWAKDNFSKSSFYIETQKKDFLNKVPRNSKVKISFGDKEYEV